MLAMLLLIFMIICEVATGLGFLSFCPAPAKGHIRAGAGKIWYIELDSAFQAISSSLWAPFVSPGPDCPSASWHGLAAGAALLDKQPPSHPSLV